MTPEKSPEISSVKKSTKKAAPKAAKAKTTKSTSNEPQAYAVIRTGGKQYKVTKGETILVEKLAHKDGESFEFKDVLFTSDGSSTQTKGKTVKAKVLAQKKAPKVVIFKKRRTKGYLKKQGHRQELTQVLIEAI